ncbi:phospho-N-acetylmuramoyl-pentapeptide-transferase [Jeotgalibacillus proteolyticus]|uniref:Phospho-N-acetylmuramoyl-pentapeptide-transferase n=1 Tax=Jeotgalibacillus proteolyticus TaxID=2082395 RepID=A0A2S5GGM5_9BACL|nr:phospho-N-acetylmuramoyl-pentapeptide-transferase [Jeotgalibacillus proteolyticus]PPA72139.1 phospho-N-acetylmuramoyl-pentapeptide-transferase [Jeotgalibacillus proteolyticus]
MSILAIFASLFGAFFVTVAVSPLFIPYLRRLKFGQSIREEGPESHQKKSGTPTMGGIIILFSIIVTSLAVTAFFNAMNVTLLLLLLVTVTFGILGFLDDFIKVVMKRNLGLTSLQKLIGQIFIAIIFYVIFQANGFSSIIAIPFTTVEINLGFLYVGFVIFWLVGFSNAVNLTDGLDGLVSGTAAIAFGAFAILAYQQEQFTLTIFCMAVVGAVLGFLVFNAHPAKVFMGDTGSLALGGAIGTVSLLAKQEVLLLLIGLVFVAETLSVIMQVTSFKLTGKRIFRMSPLHHHFELVGWSEWKVVTVFWSVGLAVGILGVLIGVFG